MTYHYRTITANMDGGIYFSVNSLDSEKAVIKAGEKRKVMLSSRRKTLGSTPARPNKTKSEGDDDRYAAGQIGRGGKKKDAGFYSYSDSMAGKYKQWHANERVKFENRIRLVSRSS